MGRTVLCPKQQMLFFGAQLVLVAALVAHFGGVFAQPDYVQWTWISGPSALNRPGVYGTQGVANGSTNHPGARSSSMKWFDEINRELWLFGGLGYGNTTATVGPLNDLWRFRLNDSTWTWMSGSRLVGQAGVFGTRGVASVNNYPGARYSALEWYDAATKELWLFGGKSVVGWLDDLWRYRFNDSTWTWVHGSNRTSLDYGVYGTLGVPSPDNRPAARLFSSGWLDGDKKELWMFGGEDSNSRYLSDLWRYRQNDSMWTWMAGSNLTNIGPVYGTKGVPSTANIPGCRTSSITWFDAPSREMFLFGGQGGGSNGIAPLTEMWRYRLNDSTWTWLSGNTTYSNGVYGTLGVASVSNYPGGREVAVGGYNSATREFWLFSGRGPASSSDGDLNDLWRYRFNDSTWTWMSGSNSTNAAGVSGTRGVASFSTRPAARGDAAAWYEQATGQFRVFGGYRSSPSFARFADLFVAVPVSRPGVTACLSCSDGSCVENSTICSTNTTCSAGFCLKPNGAPALSSLACTSSFLSHSGHCCSTACPVCNDCSTGVCEISGNNLEADCGAVDCQGKIYGWAGTATCAACTGTVPGKCQNGACDSDVFSRCSECSYTVSSRPTCGSSSCQKICPTGFEAAAYIAVSDVCYVMNESCDGTSTCSSNGSCVAPPPPAAPPAAPPIALMEPIAPPYVEVAPIETPIAAPAPSPTPLAQLAPLSQPPQAGPVGSSSTPTTGIDTVVPTRNDVPIIVGVIVAILALIAIIIVIVVLVRRRRRRRAEEESGTESGTESEL